MVILKGKVIDGNGGKPIENGAVVIEGNRIKAVCKENELPSYENAEVYTVEDACIMPGMIDAHVHMGWGSAIAVNWVSQTAQEQMAIGLRDMAQLRNAGYTGFRDMGSDTHLIKRPAAEGYLDTPRIFAAGRILTQIGGHGDSYQKLNVEASLLAYGPSFIVTGVDEVRKAARTNFRNGADFVKIMTTGGVFSQGDKAADISHFSCEEIRAAVEEAENQGSYVASHAQANRGIKTALKNGVKSIEHGFYLDDECLDIMVKNHCWFVPTLSIMHVSKTRADNNSGMPDYLKEKTLKSYEAHYIALEKARKAGVTIGMGCDFLGDAEFGCPYSKATMEIERMTAAGFTPLEVITMATRNGAEICLDLENRGTLEEGKLADVLLVAGDLEKDVCKLCNADNVKMVIQDGRIVKNIL